MKVVATDRDDLDGRIGTVIRVNPTRVSVGFGEKIQWGTYEEEFNIPPSMLELVR